jgi:hypothetical protein
MPRAGLQHSGGESDLIGNELDVRIRYFFDSSGVQVGGTDAADVAFRLQVRQHVHDIHQSRDAVVPPMHLDQVDLLHLPTKLESQHSSDCYNV